MKKIALGFVVSAVVVMSAGADELWVKDGATKQDFAQSKYKCAKEATYMPQQSAVDLSAFGGVATRRGWGRSNSQGQPQVNLDLFRACMEADGWESKPQD